MSTTDTIAIWSAAFTGVAAVAAITAAIIAAKQRRDGQRSAIAAERSAAAAEDAVREARKAAITAAEGTRAWIVYHDSDTPNVNLQDPSKQTFWVEVTLVNAGKVPTSRRKSRRAWRLMDHFAWPESNDKLYTVEEKPPLSPNPPGPPDVIHECIEIRTVDFQAVQKGALGLYFFGVEDYETLAASHRMTWCLQYQAPSKRFAYRADLSESG
jgi:type II secretory pathway pseudopilin PulG